MDVNTFLGIFSIGTREYSFIYLYFIVFHIEMNLIYIF